MKLLRTAMAALQYGTRFQGPVTPPNELLHGALSLQPLVGLFCGVFATAPVIFICYYCDSLQGFLLFSSFIYLLLVEWITRFHGLHELARVTNVLKCYGIPSEKRLSMLQNSETGNNGDSICATICLIAKALLLYLIFVRFGLFRAITPLAMILVLVPTLSRAIMLFAYPSRKYAEKRGMPVSCCISVAEKMLHVLFWYLLMAFAWSCISVFGANLLSFTSWRMTLENLSYIFTNLRKSPAFLILFIQYFIQSCIFLFPAVFFPILYWRTESEKKFGRLIPEIAEPLRETAEAVLFVICLLETDVICF